MEEKYQAFLHVALGLIVLFGIASLQAENTVWLGTTDNLEDPSNWSHGLLPNQNIIAEFNDEGSDNTTASTYDIGLDTAGIVFDDGAPAYYLYNDRSATISIGSSGVINNSSHEIIQQITNDSSGAGLIQFAGGSSGNNMCYSSYNTNPGGGITFLNSTTGTGTFQCDSVSTFTVNGDSSIGSFSSDFAGNIVLNASLTSGSLNGDDYIYGVISGNGALILTTSTEDGYLGLNNANTYTGGTVVNGYGCAGLYTFGGGTLYPTGTITVNSGTLGFYDSNQTTGSLSGIGGCVLLNPTYSLTVNQTSNQTYAGVLQGALGTTFILGTPESSAVGTLQLTGDSGGFLGDIVLQSGHLQVNGNLGAHSILINSGAKLSGIGTVGIPGNTVTVSSGGSIQPGNSVGVLTNQGNQVFEVGSIFQLEENGLTSSSPSNNLLIVGGVTTVGVGGAPIVQLFPTTNLINLNTKQAFIESAGALTVTTPFTLDASTLAEIFNLDLIDPSLSFDAHNYYITTQTTFKNAVIAECRNNTAVVIANQLDAIIDPSTSQNIFLNKLAQLSTAALVSAFDDLSGPHYATALFAVQASNRLFLRRLYDLIRPIVITEQNSCCCPGENSGCEYCGFDIWTLAGGGQRRINGARGLKLNEWDVTFGVQKTFCEYWTFGIAGSYEHDHFNYHHSNGSGKGHVWFGGLYGLYRPSCFYVLADLAYSNTKYDIHRQVVVEHFRGKPKFSQGTFYGEAGIDINCRSFLVQPFAGIEVVGFHSNAFTETERDTSGFALSVRKHSNAEAASSLGVHLTSQLPSGFSFSVDVAWLYRFTNNNSIKVSFGSLAPVRDFTVYGPNICRSSAAGAITLMQDFYNNWKVFIETSGEVWNKASTYNARAGLQLTW